MTNEFHEVLERYEALLRSGEAPKLDDFVARYPQHAGKLQRVLPIVSALAELSDEESVDTVDASILSDHSDLAEAAPKELGDFRIVREVGRGGMGIVYEAEQLSLGRRVAIKVLPFAALLDRRQLDRFRNEARAAAMLKHPNIVNVLSVGFERGVHFFAMELVEGCSLAELIQRLDVESVHEGHSDFSDDRNDASFDTIPIAALSTEHSRNRSSYYRSIGRIGMQAAQALRAAHQSGVVHRDIKPSNLMIDQDGTLLMTDFGLARIQEDQRVTMTGDMIGTLRYMSPEQICNSRTIDHRSDIYALGATLFELTAGKPAYSATAKATLLNDIVNGKANRLRSLANDVPRDLETIIAKAMAHNADARYQSADELEGDLQRFLDGRPVLARRTNSLEIGWRWCLRNRAKAALLAMSLAVLLGLAVGGPMAAQRQKNSADRLRSELYAAQMKEAHQAALVGDHRRAKRLLDEWVPKGQPDLRGFEWHWLRSATRRQNEAPAVISEGLSVHSLARTLDGSKILIGNYMGLVRCLDSTNLNELWKIYVGQIPRRIVFSADGRMLVVGSRNGRLAIVNADDGSLLLRRKFEDSISTLALSKDGILVIGTGGGVRDKADDSAHIRAFRIVKSEPKDTVTLDEIHNALAGTHRVFGLEFNAEGTKLFSVSSEPLVRTWSVPDFSPLPSLSLGSATPTAFALTADSRLVVGTALGEHRAAPTIAVYDENGKQLWRRSLRNGYPRDIEIAPDESTISVCLLGGRIHVLDYSDGTDVDQFYAHTPTGFAVSYGRTSLDLFTGGGDARVRKWKISSSFSPNGLHVEEQDILGMDYTPDGKNVVTAGAEGIVRVINCETGKVNHASKPFTPHAIAVAVNPDGRSIAIGRHGGSLQIWDYELRKQIHVLDKRESTTFDVSFFDNGRKLLSASDGEDSGVQIWDVASGKRIRKLEQEPPYTRGYVRASVSQDGKYIVATCFGGAAVVWDAHTYKQVAMLTPSKETKTRGFLGMRIAPDSRTIAIGDASGHLLLWNFETNELRTVTRFAAPIADFDFSRDGRRMVTCSNDNSVRIWDFASGRELFVSRRPKSWVWRVRFSPDERILTAATGGDLHDDKLLFWRISPEIKSP